MKKNTKSLCIQIQLKRAPKLDLERVQKIIEKIAIDKKIIKKFSIRLGNDKGFYINFIFKVNELRKAWSLLERYLYRDKKIGLSLKRSTIATCEGNSGWNDNLILHHFDGRIHLD
jgi:hypothetical protein